MRKYIRSIVCIQDKNHEDFVTYTMSSPTEGGSNSEPAAAQEGPMLPTAGGGERKNEGLDEHARGDKRKRAFEEEDNREDYDKEEENNQEEDNEATEVSLIS